MKKVVNFRPIFYSFVALGLGIYFARSIFAFNTFVIIALLTFLIISIFLAIKYKHVKRLLVLIGVFTIGMAVFALSFNTFTDHNFVNQNCVVSGRISTVKNYTNSQSVVLDNTYINGVKVNKNIVVNVFQANTLEVGYVITFEDYLQKTELFSLGQFNNYYYKYNISYTASTQDTNITIDCFDGLTLSEALRNSVKLNLNQNMSPDEASVSYAALFGDKTFVDYDITNDFSISGIAHLLAVSGLHIGFITAALSFLLNKTKFNKYVKLTIISAFLLFYCYICSFSVSVIRASLMFLVLTIAGILGKQYDRLNSLSLAGFVVLLYKPLSVFDPGFLLSFFCVFSIYMFLPFFARIFKKLHLPKKLTDSLAIIVSVQIGLLPLTIYYYGKMSILTILANLICVPIFEIFFIMLFAFTIVTLIIPPLGFILKLPALIITGIIKLAQITASQKWAIIPLGFVSPLLIVIVYFVMFIFSHYLNLNIKQKINIGVTILVFGVVVAIANAMPVYNVQNINILNTYNTTTYVLELDNKTYSIGEHNYSSLATNTKYLQNISHKPCDYLFLMGDELIVDNELYSNIYSFSVDAKDNYIAYNLNYKFNNVAVRAVSYDGTLCMLHIMYNNVNYLFCLQNTKYEHIYTYIQTLNKVDFLFCFSEYVDKNLNELNATNFIIDGNYIVANNIEQKDITGNWTLELSSDKIKSIRSID
ncbi:MAG: ComEC/Rec2 family competence protein [Clostridiales bacterium]|nr:ComEC/Rec2 family competence protein [Clostridiales bacterium]